MPLNQTVNIVKSEKVTNLNFKIACFYSSDGYAATFCLV